MIRTAICTLFVGAAILGAARLGPLKPEPASQSGFLDADACQLQIDDAAQASARVRHGNTRAVLIGDSWATGAGVYPDLLAAKLELDLSIAAAGGTGYINPGACGGREFMSRVWEVPPNARLVVVAGGVNDVFQPADALENAVRDVLAGIHARAPGARVVVLGVPRVQLLDDEATGAVDDVLKSVAGDAFVDVRDWDISTQQDRIHPDVAGAREYAERIAAAIAAN